MKKTTQIPHDATTFAGIDVSKNSLDLAIMQGEKILRQLTVENNHAGFKKIIAEIKKHQPQLILWEATGKYHLNITAALVADECPIAVANPYQTKI